MADIIPHQPIVFDQEADCWLESGDVKLLAEYGDITQFQMSVSPCASDYELYREAALMMTIRGFGHKTQALGPSTV